MPGTHRAPYRNPWLWALASIALLAASAGARAVPIQGPALLTVSSSLGPGGVIDLELSSTGSIHVDLDGVDISGLSLLLVSTPGSVRIDSGNPTGIAFPHDSGDLGTADVTDAERVEVLGDVLLAPASGAGGSWDRATLQLFAGGDVFIYNLGDGALAGPGGAGGGTLTISSVDIDSGALTLDQTVSLDSIVAGPFVPLAGVPAAITLALPESGSLSMQVLGLGLLGWWLLARRARVARA